MGVVVGVGVVVVEVVEGVRVAEAVGVGVAVTTGARVGGRGVAASTGAQEVDSVAAAVFIAATAAWSAAPSGIAVAVFVADPTAGAEVPDVRTGAEPVEAVGAATAGADVVAPVGVVAGLAETPAIAAGVEEPDAVEVLGAEGEAVTVGDEAVPVTLVVLVVDGTTESAVSCAWARASWAWASVTAACRVVGSMVAKVSPTVTTWPTWTGTADTVPLTGNTAVACETRCTVPLSVSVWDTGPRPAVTMR